MKVFVAGASDVLGRAAVRQLAADGDTIVGLVRDEEEARTVSALGGIPAVGSIFDCEFLRRSIHGCDVVMHLASAIPQKRKPAPSDWTTNDRLRREGTRNLIEAAKGEKLYAFVQQSTASIYGDRRGDWVTEAEPPHPDTNLVSALEGERIVLAAYNEFGLPGVILRGASLYGSEIWSTRNLISGIKQRSAPIIGSGEQYWHYIYVEDMASACVSAAKNPAPGEIFFVADDWPFHARELLNYLAEQLKAPSPIKMTVTLARVLGGDSALFFAQSVRYRTDKIKKMLGWTPRYPTFHEGFAEILPRLGVSYKSL